MLPNNETQARLRPHGMGPHCRGETNAGLDRTAPIRLGRRLCAPSRSTDMTRIAINGFGRIGRCILRALSRALNQAASKSWPSTT